MSRLELLGKNIKKYREVKGFSQELLAEKVDLSREYITRVENGQKFISLRKLFLLADVLGVNFCDLTNFE
jgi:transcriptional regulator with XRE-family HTH domain